MPKARKSKSKGKKARVQARKTKRKKTAPVADSGTRDMVIALIDRLGASSAFYQDSKDQLIVAHFNRPPFIVDLTKHEIIPVSPVETTPVETHDTAEKDAAE